MIYDRILRKNKDCISIFFSLELCAAAAKLADDSSVETLYAAAGTAAALGCPIKLGSKVCNRKWSQQEVEKVSCRK